MNAYYFKFQNFLLLLLLFLRKEMYSLHQTGKGMHGPKREEHLLFLVWKYFICLTRFICTLTL